MGSGLRRAMASIVSPIVAGVLIEHHMLSTWAWTAAAVAAVGIVVSRNSVVGETVPSADPVTESPTAV